MAGSYNNQFQQNLGNMPPLQTHHQSQYANQRAFSPPSFQQSPGAMSPNMGGIPPAKRQRLSPNPPSPYQSPFSASPYSTSPYGAGSPPSGQHLSLPHSPATGYPTPSFHQPQPYQHTDDATARPAQGSMPPPKVPYSKVQDNAELEKANPREMDVNNISDVLTGSGIDLRAEEDNLLHTFRSHNNGNSFNSQASGSTVSPHGSFNWSQSANGHGAFQGTGPLSQPVSQEQLEAEVIRKHEAAARAYAESAQAPLSDPFLFANLIRHKLSQRAYENGLKVNLEGLFDKIPDTPQNVTRTTLTGSNGESIAAVQADSLLNHNAPFVDILSLVSLAAEDRLRGVLEDAFALSQGRQNTSHGIVPPNLADLAFTNGEQKPKATTAIPQNISNTAWEAPDSAISPMTVTASKQMNAARLPTPPTEAPPTPQPTVAFTNHVANTLKRKVTDDYKFEEARLAKRRKRQQGPTAAAAAETPAVAPIPVPEKMTKKERDRINKIGQSEDQLHQKANETANLALGISKKKYSWMTGGGGGGSGASTPRKTGAGGAPGSGTSTPAQAPVDRALQGTRRKFGEFLESGDIGKKIQVRDIIHVLELDGKERKTIVSMLARLKNSDKDDDKRASTSR